MNIRTLRHTLASYAGSRRGIAWIGGLFLAAIVAQAALDIAGSYRGAVRATERELDAQARVIGEQTARAVQAVDVVLQGLVEQLQGGPLAHASRDELHAYLRERARELVQSDGLVVANPDGTVRALSLLPPEQTPTDNFSRAEPFMSARANTSGNLLIDTTRLSPGTTDLWVFPMTRRLTGPRGEFLGLVGARGQVAYFQQFYRDAFPDRSTRISLLHRNGALLARHPPTPTALGRRVENLDALLPESASAPAKVRRLPSPIDGIDHFVAIRLVPNYPLAVAVSREAEVALAAWRSQAMATALRTLALVALAGWLLVVVLRQITRLNAAHRSVEASQARYALAAAGADDGIWDWDLATGTAYESQRARELQGLPPGPETQPLAELQASLGVHPDDAALREHTLQAHLAGQSAAYEVEYRVRHADGGYRWIRVRALCVRDAAGRPLRMAGSVADIDARKRAEAALRESEERYALAMTGSNEGHWLWNMPAGQVYVSAKLAELFGFAGGAQVMAASHYFDGLPLHPDDRERVHRNRHDHVAGLTERLDHEFRIVVAGSGEVRWVHTRAQCFRDAAGQPLRMAGSTVDATERKRAETALRESEERYALAMAGSRGGHWVWNAATDALFVSGTLNELFGLAADAAPGTRREYFARVKLHPEDRDRLYQLSEDLRSGRVDRADYEYRIVQPDGSVRWILNRAQRFAPQDGREKPASTRIAGVSIDISERKQAEAERERLGLQLRQAQKLEAIGTLAGGIAHDFNNILSAILGYGELVQRNAPAGTPLRRHIDAAMSAGQRAKSLVQRILAFSRSGIGERVPVHVQSVVEEALDAVAASLPPGVRMVRQLASGDAGLLGDPTQLHQVVLNLCANAAQAMRDGGELRVSAQWVPLVGPLTVTTSVLAPGPYVRLAVSDTGSGIAPQLLERIFDPFFTTKEVGVGTGLGLSLVHGIVTDLGGGIAVHSAVGEGSSFTVWLPAQRFVAAPAADEVPLVQGQGQTVLLVDDEEPLVRLGEEMLATLGYEPVGFASSQAALEAFLEDPGQFDAVLSDEAMPGMTGSELATAVRARRPDIPIVLMSGFVSPALAQRARELGVHEVLAKPLASGDIARCLASAVKPRLPMHSLPTPAE